MQCGGDKHGADPGPACGFQIATTRAAAADRYAQIGMPVEHRGGQSERGDSVAGADAGEVEDQNSAEPGRVGLVDQVIGFGRSPSRAQRDDRASRAQVEAEDLVRRVHCSQILRATQRFGRQHDRRRARVPQANRRRRVARTGVDCQSQSQVGRALDERIIRSRAGDRVEIGDVHLGRAERAAIGAHERQWVRSSAEDALNRPIFLAMSSARMHRLPVFQVNDGNDDRQLKT